MSFENGYNINDYIGKTIEAYQEDKNIFNKVLITLNIFMQREDWPMCFKEFENISSQILKSDAEWICRTIGMFESQDPNVNPQVKDWDKELEYNFKNEIKYFVNVVNPIINEYYNYLNNPLGINNVIEIQNYSPLKMIRIHRNDGVNIDFRLSNYEIEQLISTLKGLIGER